MVAFLGLNCRVQCITTNGFGHFLNEVLFGLVIAESICDAVIIVVAHHNIDARLTASLVQRNLLHGFSMHHAVVNDGNALLMAQDFCVVFMVRIKVNVLVRAFSRPEPHYLSLSLLLTYPFTLLTDHWNFDLPFKGIDIF